MRDERVMPTRKMLENALVSLQERLNHMEARVASLEADREAYKELRDAFECAPVVEPEFDSFYGDFR